jgi:hypothetical protein
MMQATAKVPRKPAEEKPTQPPAVDSGSVHQLLTAAVTGRLVWRTGLAGLSRLPSSTAMAALSPDIS